ncbi:MAG: NOG1 family protein [Candidatus Odinarchaeia archaeon]
MNPFENVKYFSSPDEILNKALRRGARISVELKSSLPKVVRAKIEEKERINRITQIIVDYLRNIVSNFPSLDSIEPFYKELTDILVGIDNLKKVLAAIDGSVTVAKRLAKLYRRQIAQAKTLDEIHRAKKAFIGRISSVIKRLKKRLLFLRDSIGKLKRLPSVNPKLLTVVVAGHPNVGKSTFVKSVSSANPIIAEYPFTTRNIIIGHTKISDQIVQIIDTPGLLDRPLEERNQIELQAIAALKYLARAVIYLLDASETCGYSFKDQVSLLNKITEFFKEIPIIPVLNKVDLTPENKIIKAKKMLGPVNEVVASDEINARKILEHVVKQLT